MSFGDKGKDNRKPRGHMSSTANYTCQYLCCKAPNPRTLLFRQNFVYITCEDEFVLPSSLFTSLLGRKFGRRVAPFIKLIVRNFGFRGYATKAYAIKFHQSTTSTICIFAYRKKGLYVLFRFFIVVDFYGGIGGIHLYHNKRIHKLTFL